MRENVIANSEAPDYSRKDCWYQIPEITKDVDTIYIYATEYIMGSFEEGAPDYATLDNADMLQGAAGTWGLSWRMRKPANLRSGITWQSALPRIRRADSKRHLSIMRIDRTQIRCQVRRGRT